MLQSSGPNFADVQDAHTLFRNCNDVQKLYEVELYTAGLVRYRNFTELYSAIVQDLNSCPPGWSQGLHDMERSSYHVGDVRRSLFF